jgi:hypothetical protein
MSEKRSAQGKRRSQEGTGDESIGAEVKAAGGKRAALRVPFSYVYDFDRLSLQREKVGVLQVNSDFEWVSSIVTARFGCRIAFKAPGFKRSPMIESHILGTPQFPMVHSTCSKIKKNARVIVYVLDTARDEGRKWNRVQIVLDGFHVFNIKRRKARR